MATNARFIKSVTTAAEDTKVEMPWTRGKRRAEFISRRSGSKDEDQRKSA